MPFTWNLHTQGWAYLPFPGLVNFVPAVAYHFCLILSEKFSQPGNGILAQTCSSACGKSAIGHLESQTLCHSISGGGDFVAVGGRQANAPGADLGDGGQRQWRRRRRRRHPADEGHAVDRQLGRVIVSWFCISLNGANQNQLE